ncbi:uncharacterized protein (UPF0303 family) [Paenibacillus mucilaginosus]|uniref:heme-degrading domain-containing protein n=1 Tax=Paenibacillus mucilaginosus TaxID=61624 RepID=UPI003D25ACCC
MLELERKVKEMEEQERVFQFEEFTHETALELGLLLVQEAKRSGVRVTVDITRSGQRLFLHAMEGTTVGNEDWIRRKNNLTGRFGRSSWHTSMRLRLQGEELERDYGLPVKDYAAAGGSFPLHVKGEGILGTITVSGLPDQEDHDLVIGALQKYFDGLRQPE